MSPSRKLWLATAGVCLFVAVLVGAVGALLVLGGEGVDAEGGGLTREASVVASAMLVLAACALAWSALRHAHALYLRAPLRMAEEVDALVGNSGARIGDYGADELRALAQAVNRLADERQSLEGDVAARVAEARASLEEERSRLAALMADLEQSVVVCNLDGRVLLYNQRARQELSADAEGGGAELLGLGRSIYTVFDRALIAHALERLQQARGERGGMAGAAGSAQFVTATRAGRLLRAHMSPVLGGGKAGGATNATDAPITGFVLILDDITAANERDARRDALIQALTEGGRGPLGNIRAAAETLSDFGDMAPAQRERFLGVIRDEARALSQHFEKAAAAFSNDLRERWLMEEMLGAEFVAVAMRRIAEHCSLAVKSEHVDESIWLRIDGFGLLQALTFLAARLEDEYGEREVREVRLSLTRGGGLAQLDLAWTGTSMNNETAMTWQMDAMRIGGDRPEFYDFDLFGWSAGSHALDDRPLGELAYTVFDTETTGLSPSEGDEIIQIGATRIVNRRLLRHECMDQLVDPRRLLSRESIRVHGITPDLLAGQPTIETVLPAFHAFCADTVLVAHNAAFDMRFLQLKEAALGLRFDQPVLDTLLLSAVLHPNQESHRLEAIAERLGVSVVGRHTALGDAMVTGEVFLKMLPLLAAMGIHTLREAREASEKTYHARLRY